MNVPVSQTIGSDVDYTEEMKTAYSYTRFSSLEQKKGESARRQSEAAIKWCEENGYTLSEDHFKDEGRSAYKGKHLEGEGDLKRFLSLVESGKIRSGSVLILESFDRFSRLPMVKAVSLFLNVIQSDIGMVFTMTHGQKLITAKAINNEPYIIYSIIGEAQRAHSESKHKSERVADACRARNERAKTNGGAIKSWTPPWCEYQDGKYIVNEAKAAIVKRIYNEYISGVGPYRMAILFNKEKIPTMNRSRTLKTKGFATEWYKKLIRDTLLDARVYGYAHHLQKEKYYPVIISKDTFNKVQNRLALRAAEKPTGGPSEGIPNLFTSVCRCSQCGHVMGKNQSTKTYRGIKTKYEYLCCEGAKTGKRCSYKSIPYEWIENTFFEVLNYDGDFHGTMSNKTDKTQERLAILHGEYAATEKQITKLAENFLKVENPPAILMAHMNDFEGKKKGLLKAIRLAEAEIQNAKIPSNVKEIVKQYRKSQDDPKFRLKVKEYIKAAIKEMRLDTSTETPNYQIKFRDGSVISVVMKKAGKELSKGVRMQVSAGERKEWVSNVEVISI